MPEQGQERCIEEITEDDTLCRLLCQEKHRHGREAGQVVFYGKGNRSLPCSDDEEDWEISISGFSDEIDRPGMLKDSGSGGTEQSRQPGESEDREGSGLEMPVRRVWVVEGVFEGIETTVCSRLAQIQPVHACATPRHAIP